MISICPHCGNDQWNKTATATHITCPACNHTWPYHQGRLYLLSGCSGVGKTTTAIHLSSMAEQFSVLDADMFYAPDPLSMLEQICHLSATLNHQGRPILWTMAGGLDRIQDTYHRQFFAGISCLALTCESDELRRRMTVGRGITDKAWLNGSQEYNEYFRTHNALEDVTFDTLDISHLTPYEVAAQVLAWMHSQLQT